MIGIKKKLKKKDEIWHEDFWLLGVLGVERHDKKKNDQIIGKGSGVFKILSPNS